MNLCILQAAHKISSYRDLPIEFSIREIKTRMLQEKGEDIKTE